MSRMLPEALRDRPELNLRPGIKSSLNNWRQLIASLYLFYLYTLDGGECVYGKEMSSSGQKSLRIKDEFSAWLDVRCANLDNAKQLVQNCPLFAAQMEPLQVGIELFLKLAKVDFVNSSLPYSAERTGGNRYAKQLRFSTNMKVLGDVLSIFSNAEREGFLKSWLNGIDDSIVCERIKEILLTFTEECQYKIRTTSSEIFFRQDGIYERLRGGGNTVESSDVHESVGPFRILKSYVKDGMHPYLVDSTDGFKIKAEVHVLEKYADMVQTTLGLIPKRTTIYQEVESSPGALSLPTPECNADRLTVALKLFAEQRAAWRAAMDKNKGPTYQFVNADVRAFFGKNENWDVAQLKTAEGLKDFCINHTWMLCNGKGSWVQISGYNDTERANLVDWIDKRIVKGEAALQDVIVDDNGLKGFTNKAASELLMKFHPESYILCNGPTIDSLKFLRSEWAVKGNYSYADYLKVLGAAAVIRDRMAEMKIYATTDGTTPPDFLAVNEFIFFVSENKDLIKEKVMASTYKKTEIKKVEQKPIGDFSDFIKKLEDDIASAGLKYAPNLMKRFVCAQLAKPFVVLTGLSGSGKTKLAEAFTKWIGVENTVNIVPVGADWTNNEKLLGYPNALDSEKYVMPDTGVLKLMLDANENKDLPFFLILDEMNLSHVERYFADFLSTMESNDGIIELYDSGKRYAEDGREIPPSFPFPKNLFVIGTMNVDETTYMFSPKVLDRAQVIEFRVSEKEMTDFLTAPGNPKIDELAGKGAAYAKAFLGLAAERKTKDIGADEKKKFNELLIGKVDPKTKELDGLFTALAKLGAEFGYRSAIEMVIFIAYYLEASAYGKLKQSVDRKKFLKDAIDAAVLQKLLPKLHGSLNRLGPVIDALISKVTITQTDQNGDSDTTLIYPLTCEKLLRMKDRVEKNGFTSFAEA